MDLFKSIYIPKVMVLWNADISQLKYRTLSACRLTTNLIVFFFFKVILTFRSRKQPPAIANAVNVPRRPQHRIVN